MAEPIIEQIAVWINDALDGKSDPDGTLTLRAVRPKILDWSTLQLIHGDVAIELGMIETLDTDTRSYRREKATFLLHGFVDHLPDGVKADTYLARCGETIRRLVLAGNIDAHPLSGLALSIDCPEVVFLPVDGGVKVIVTCIVEYSTAIYDGYSQD
jgi:hypothetical protein